MNIESVDKFYAVWNPKTQKFLGEYEFVDSMEWTEDASQAAGFFDDMRILRFYRHYTSLFDEKGCLFVPVTVKKTVTATVELDKARTFNEAADLYAKDLA